ncbi:hypothetical protein IGS73_03935 [Janibacter indicus]|uniref:Uncharacterized protein n=1 Tax=Janibacter indicus TaxID=857417 RepID=A0A7L9J3H9_9MICO|nr:MULTISPECIES: hypothetical protein [Janibacter]QNF94940.1 hypothetical protein H7A72_03875 [Janibacter sp. YB324]QOK23563.1 hypothetical protein IGS73_03935 [Janibacter indicus]
MQFTEEDLEALPSAALGPLVRHSGSNDDEVLEVALGDRPSQLRVALPLVAPMQLGLARKAQG